MRLAARMFMAVVNPDPSILAGRWIMGALVTALFTAVARWLRGVNNSGALAGAVCCFVLYLGAGAAAVSALITVFVLAWVTTRIGYRRKQSLGVAEKQEGRSASQVLANLGVAAICSAIYFFGSNNAALLLGISAALSEAAADTVSSEVGQAFGDKARLITNWQTVPAGTNGAVSLRGTLAGIAAATIVSAVCATGGLIPLHFISICAGAAILGMIVDSFLGAWLERRNLLNNDSVNFLSTLVSAAASVWLTH